jgi:DNA-binding response OmpR family regulator
MLVRAYQDKLAMEGFEMDSAFDGLEAIQKLGSIDYDLILLDLILPKIIGLDVLKQLRSSGWPASKKPVIVFSNLGDATDINMARKLGADDYLVKANLTPNQVVDKIRQYLE